MTPCKLHPNRDWCVEHQAGPQVCLERRVNEQAGELSALKALLTEWMDLFVNNENWDCRRLKEKTRKAAGK